MKRFLLAATTMLAIFSLATGCNNSNNASSGAGVNAPAAKANDPADKTKSYDWLKGLVVEELAKLDAEFKNPDTVKLIAVGTAPAEKLPDLQKRYAEAKSKADTKPEDLDKLVSEYAAICDAADAATRQILTKIRDGLKKMNDYLFYMDYTDSKRFAADQPELDKLNEPTMKIRHALGTSGKLVLPLNERVRELAKGNEYTPENRAKWYKEAARAVMEKKLTEPAPKKN